MHRALVPSLLVLLFVAPARTQAPGPLAVALGADFGCGLGAGGDVRCWGSNRDGQAGGPGDVVPTPRAVAGLDQVKAIAVGYAHACALRQDGAVWCWGDNGYGQLGTTDAEERATPAAVPGLSDVEEVALGGFFSCARRADGAVLCWGSDSSGSLGTGRSGESRAEPRPVPGVRGATRLFTGRGFACALDRRGRVRCWGSSSHGQAGTRRRVRQARPTVLRGVGADDELILADGFGCALSDGALRCWGQNLLTIGGNGDVGMHPAPVPETRLADVQAFAALKEEACAVTGGEVRCWGVNRRQQLQVPTPEMGGIVLVPTAVPGVSDATDVVMGYYAQCLRRTSGEWACWGWNRGASYGAVGVGSTARHVETPTRLPW
ncbi:MAG: hypothetical protein AAGH15_00375 [Myxococcota bacterium]